MSVTCNQLQKLLGKDVIFYLSLIHIFYREALDLHEVRRKEAGDGSFILVYLGDGQTPHSVELTWLRDRKEPYNLGDNEIHLALSVDDFEAAYAHHKAMGCICFEKDVYKRQPLP